MCGLFGANVEIAPERLDAVSRALAHRGPDEEGRLSHRDGSLLHRRLKIIDLSPAAAQPMTNEDGTIQVVFNGEIYNHKSLRAELEGGHTFRSRSDTEVIVHGYEAWGDDVVRRLDGMFALAVWDRRRGRFLVARDRAGKKPLFWAFFNDRLYFGSTVASLFAAGVPSEIDASALPFYLSYGFVPAPRTMYRHVHQLPPASRLRLERGAAPVVDIYWEPSFVGGCTDDYDTAQERVRSLVAQAVEARLESDVPLGAFLSGGIDSTIIVGLMRRALGPGVKTFSIGFKGDPRYDETSYARIAARAFETDHTEFTLEPSSIELVDELVRHHDGPFGDSSAVPTYMVSKLTRQHVTVALTGDGGDELFCGYHRFLAAEAAERIPQPIRRAAALASARFPVRSERSLLGRADRFLRAAALPLADRLARWNSFFADPRVLLRADVADTLGEDALSAPLAWQREVIAAAAGPTVMARVLEHNFRTYLPYDLLVKADRVSMANSLETRSPFLDTRLFEYVATLPPAYLRRGTFTKRILKDAFADLLPSEIRNRGKMGFGVPLGTWFRGNLAGYLHDRLGRGARIDELLDRSAVDKLLDEHRREAADHGQRLWLLLTLELWLRSLGSAALQRAA